MTECEKKKRERKKKSSFTDRIKFMSDFSAGLHTVNWLYTVSCPRRRRNKTYKQKKRGVSQMKNWNSTKQLFQCSLVEHLRRRRVCLGWIKFVEVGATYFNLCKYLNIYKYCWFTDQIITKASEKCNVYNFIQKFRKS